MLSARKTCLVTVPSCIVPEIFDNLLNADIFDVDPNM